MALMVFDADGADDVMTDGVAGAGGWPMASPMTVLLVPRVPMVSQMVSKG